jgi:hypothetical protein
MKDWKALAQAKGLAIPAQELDRIVAPLEALEATFRPLIRDLTPEMEPSTCFRAEGDHE